MLNFESLLFNIDIDAPTARPGWLLVAEPFLRDSYFRHAVVCLIECELLGKAMGIVLNHPTGYSLQQLLSTVTRREPVRVYCGGPMSCDRLYFIHTLGNIFEGARPLGNGLYIGGDFDSMVAYLNAGYPVDGHIRFFLGYSGWSEGQLDEELGNHVWAVAEPPADPSVVLSLSDDALWHNTVRTMGPRFRGWRFHPKNLNAN